MTPEDPIPLNRLERGRDLTDHECATFLADRQTALRHGTAPIAVEVADTYRERALAAESRVARFEQVLHYDSIHGVLMRPHGLGCSGTHLMGYGSCQALSAQLLELVEPLAEPRRNALEADL